MAVTKGRLEHDTVLFSVLDSSSASSTAGELLSSSEVLVEQPCSRPERRTRCVAAVVLTASTVAAYAGLHRRRAPTTSHSQIDDMIARQLLLSIQGPVASTCGALHKDADYEYSNLAGLGHLDNIVSSQDCCTLCQGEPTCMSFTWVKDAHLLVGNPGQCWLKGGRFAQRSPKEGVYSAFVRDDKVAALFAQDADVVNDKDKDEKAPKKPAAKEPTKKAGDEKEPEKARTTLTTTDSPTTTPLSTCCSYAPFKGCGDALNISHICDRNKDSCEIQCAGHWLEHGAKDQREGMNVHPPTPAPEPTAPPPRKSSKPCCSYDPLPYCGDELAISKFCDVSQARCEKECSGKWLDGGPKDNPHGIDLYTEYVPSDDDSLPSSESP